MKKLTILVLSLLISTQFAVGKSLKLKEPPRELKKYYPPNSENYEFTNLMYSLSTSLTGLITNVKAGDWENAKNWSEKFKENYLKIGKLVKRWDKVLRKKQVDNLMNAVKGKDKREVFRSLKVISKSCIQCHKNYRLSVQVIYHSPNFHNVKLEDPVIGSNLGIHKYMKNLTNDLKLLKIFIEQSDKNKAVKYGQNFIKRFNGLTQSCSDCHTNKLSKEIYFGSDVRKHINSLKLAIGKFDKNRIVKELNWISTNNCMKCHNVHKTLFNIRERLEN